ncbi:hypothetical protein H0H93_008510 [Arthromyces matolae]|nr:hypothetical protein H0H93_008510 [Arthromyces matolae]
MFARSAVRVVAQPASRFFSSTASRNFKVAVLGAGGGIGQPLSLLLKSDPLVTSLSLYDIRGAPGVAADVSHVDTTSEVNGYAADQLDQALEGVEVVVIPAGVPRKSVSGEALKALVQRIQYGGDEVVKAKDGAGSATLSMAYAGAKFTHSLLRGLNGEKGVVTPTFVQNPVFADKGVDFFASNVELGVNGVENIQPIGELSAAEDELLQACLPELKKNIDKGKAFAAPKSE